MNRIKQIREKEVSITRRLKEKWKIAHADDIYIYVLYILKSLLKLDGMQWRCEMNVHKCNTRSEINWRKCFCVVRIECSKTNETDLMVDAGIKWSKIEKKIPKKILEVVNPDAFLKRTYAYMLKFAYTHIICLYLVDIMWF